MIHCSTVEERVRIISQMLATPTHGLISQLSRSHHVSRQTLYRWVSKGKQALEEALRTPLVPHQPQDAQALLVLTLLLETHASYREVQTCLRDLHGMDLSLGKIAGIVKEAGVRAQGWLKQQQAPTARTLTLDEQYSSQWGKAYLNVVDAHSGQVWATVPPVPVDGESWMLLLGCNKVFCVRLSREESAVSSLVPDGTPGATSDETWETLEIACAPVIRGM
ncbi:helix-turn-helix domain-containing protein [Dictyobacter aurantiacus]|uniref:Transposase n=1 Tax=Dictyobacter aurantiacus TaxID=1936993 RepID=A0A401Z9I5_9CHLR|nr:helix-turn-helix domain-containing protein [Dictyobacter aurantiacus]GCE03502.1 hypothetical protein KDAU_08310 [Dictyobacter aurantiacus]